MTTTHTKNRVYSGPSKVDNGYLRPLILDLLAGGGGSGTITAWNGSGAKPVISGVGLLVGTVGSVAEGEIWKKTSLGQNNTDWVSI